MSLPRSYYDVLHVDTTASGPEVKAAYLVWTSGHEDETGSIDDEATREVNKAFAVLSDPARRAEYDAILLAPVEPTVTDSTLQSTVRPIAPKVSQFGAYDIFKVAPQMARFPPPAGWEQMYKTPERRTLLYEMTHNPEERRAGPELNNDDDSDGETSEIRGPPINEEEEQPEGEAGNIGTPKRGHSDSINHSSPTPKRAKHDPSTPGKTRGRKPLDPETKKARVRESQEKYKPQRHRNDLSKQLLHNIECLTTESSKTPRYSQRSKIFRANDDLREAIEITYRLAKGGASKQQFQTFYEDWKDRITPCENLPVEFLKTLRRHQPYSQAPAPAQTLVYYDEDDNDNDEYEDAVTAEGYDDPQKDDPNVLTKWNKTQLGFWKNDIEIDPRVPLSVRDSGDELLKWNFYNLLKAFDEQKEDLKRANDHLDAHKRWTKSFANQPFVDGYGFQTNVLPPRPFPVNTTDSGTQTILSMKPLLESYSQSLKIAKAEEEVDKAQKIQQQALDEHRNEWSAKEAQKEEARALRLQKREDLQRQLALLADDDKQDENDRLMMEKEQEALAESLAKPVADGKRKLEQLRGELSVEP